MRSNAGMANRQGDVDLRFAQVSAPQLTLWFVLAWLGLAWRGSAWRGLMWPGLAVEDRTDLLNVAKQLPL
jgi:hypothetical protein